MKLTNDISKRRADDEDSGMNEQMNKQINKIIESKIKWSEFTY